MERYPIPRYENGDELQKGDLVWVIEEDTGIVGEIYPRNSSIAIQNAMSDGGGLVHTDSGLLILYDAHRFYQKEIPKAIIEPIVIISEKQEIKPVDLSILRVGTIVRICFEALAVVCDIAGPDSEVYRWFHFTEVKVEFSYFGMAEILNNVPVFEEWINGPMRKATTINLPWAWIQGDIEILKKRAVENSHRRNG